MTPTLEQQSIIQSVTSISGCPPSSLMIEAYAGTAKTTTLQFLAPAIRVPTLALAFNKKIAEELRPRLPHNFEVRTLNSLGHFAWARANPSISSWKLDDRKLGRLVTQVAKARKIDLASDQWTDIRQLVSSAMLVGIVPNSSSDLIESWKDLYLSFAPSSNDFDFIQDLALEVLLESNQLSRQGIISFDDQIYCSTCLDGLFPRFPALIVDESQDLSPLNHSMISSSTFSASPVIAVGDSRQAVYAFRGADSSSMENLRQLRSSWLDRSLTTTFRCPKVIVTRQQQHAPGFTAFESNPTGFFLQTPWRTDVGGSWSWKYIEDYLQSLDGAEWGGRVPKLAVLCRNNSPLLSLAFKLIRQGIGCHMLGRDIGRGLSQLSSKLASDDSTPILQFLSKLREWADHEISLALANDKPSRVERITDQLECLRATIDGADPRSAGDLRAALERLFSRTDGLVTLSSIHRAKGLEWDCILHLDPWRIPSRQALRAGDIALQQERNLLYIAETRTRHTLINANLEDFR